MKYVGNKIMSKPESVTKIGILFNHLFFLKDDN